MVGPIPRKALPVPTAERGYFSMSNRRVFTVRAEAHTESGAVFVREAVVWLTGKGERPFRLLGWRQGRLRELAAPAE